MACDWGREWVLQLGAGDLGGLLLGRECQRGVSDAVFNARSSDTRAPMWSSDITQVVQVVGMFCMPPLGCSS
ncbi:hypothetical protein XELAEV_18001643mg [Xenopus laevis]|nr:hypothetical protein XELAEV_18001643mg [Xenopus laevis]